MSNSLWSLNSFKQFFENVFTGDYCGFPAVPINGKIKYASATECDYECSNGFVLTGGNKSTCNPETGQWSPLPVCQPCWTTVQVPFLCDRKNFYIIEGLGTRSSLHSGHFWTNSCRKSHIEILATMANVVTIISIVVLRQIVVTTIIKGWLKPWQYPTASAI